MVLKSHALNDDDDTRKHEKVPLGRVPVAHAPLAAQSFPNVHGQYTQRANATAPGCEVQIGIADGGLVVGDVRGTRRLADVHLRQAVRRVHDNRQSARPHCHDDEREQPLEDRAHEERRERIVAKMSDGRQRREGEAYGRGGCDPHIDLRAEVLVVRLVRGEAQR